MNATERKAWLRERQSGLGATDLAAICGVGYRTAADVYAEKTGESDDRPALGILRMGLATEPLNAELYQDRFLKPDDALLEPGLVRSKSHDWMFATFDRIASHRRPGETDLFRAVELKYVRFFTDAWGPDGSDFIPDGYSIQATWQHTVALTAYPTRKIDPPHLAALDSGGDHRVYPVVYSERLADLLLEIGEDFWRRVQTRQPVGPDWVHPLGERAKAECATIRTDSSIRLDDTALGIVERMEEAKAIEKKAEEEYQLRKRELRALLGEIEVGILPDGRRVRQYVVPEKLITVKPYIREARVDLRILKGRS